MMAILDAFCGGLAFSAGALVGCVITSKLGATVWSKRHADLLEIQSRAEDRLAKQVELLVQMSKALERAMTEPAEAGTTNSTEGGRES